MASHTTAMYPGADQSVHLQVGAGSGLSFDFDPYKATMSRVGQDLVLTIYDTVELTLEGFFSKAREKAEDPFAPIKDFLFQGQEQIFLENQQ